MSAKILVVEDEEKLAALLRDYLLQSGMEVWVEADGANVMATLQACKADLVLLDLMLPNKDGLSICREIRQSQSFQQLPVIITTARVDEIDRLLGLEIGADDYICKPYSPREVVARVKAVLRRMQQPVAAQPDVLTLEDDKMKASLRGCDLDLTAVEYALLRLMAENPGRIFSRAKMMDAIYQDHRIVSERTIDSHIKKLRRKIANADSSIELVHSVYGVGYKLEYPVR